MQKLFLKNIKPPKLQIREASSIPPPHLPAKFLPHTGSWLFKKPEITFKQAERAEFLPVFVVLSGSGEVTYREPLSEGGMISSTAHVGDCFFSTVPGNTPTSVRMKIHGNFSGSISTVPRPGHIIPISGITITGISALLISQN